MKNGESKCHKHSDVDTPGHSPEAPFRWHTGAQASAPWCTVPFRNDGDKAGLPTASQNSVDNDGGDKPCRKHLWEGEGGGGSQTQKSLIKLLYLIRILRDRMLLFLEINSKHTDLVNVELMGSLVSIQGPAKTITKPALGTNQQSAMSPEAWHFQSSCC